MFGRVLQRAQSPNHLPLVVYIDLLDLGPVEDPAKPVRGPTNCTNRLRRWGEKEGLAVKCTAGPSHNSCC